MIKYKITFLKSIQENKKYSITIKSANKPSAINEVWGLLGISIIILSIEEVI